MTAPEVAVMRDRLLADGALPAKTKVMMALLWSVAARCSPCIEFYAGKLSEIGAAQAELDELTSVAVTMGACVAETWAKRAVAAVRREVAGSDRVCICSHQLSASSASMSGHPE